MHLQHWFIYADEIWEKLLQNKIESNDKVQTYEMSQNKLPDYFQEENIPFYLFNDERNIL